MLIRDTGDRLTYEVRSSGRGKEWWRVHLEAFDGNGDCECPDFQCRKANHLRRRHGSKERMRLAPPLQCKHLEFAMIHHARKHVRLVIDLLEKNRVSPKAIHNSED